MIVIGELVIEGSLLQVSLVNTEPNSNLRDHVNTFNFPYQQAECKAYAVDCVRKTPVDVIRTCTAQ